MKLQISTRNGDGLMEWVDRMNKVIDFVEDNLLNEIDTEEIARIMACPFSVFQRSFIQITGIPLTEYVRRRKLTCAACDIQNTAEKIINISLKYGYESADAFTVAFRRLHGVSPAAARKSGVKLKFCARLHFTLIIKGVFEMDYRFVEKDSFKVIGRRRVTPSGGGTWGVAREDGSIAQMEKLETGKPFLGLCFGFGEDGSNDYMVGLEYEGGDIQGLECYTYPKASWLIFTADGSVNENVLGNTWNRIYSEFLPQSEYKQTELPTIESYLEWNNDSDYCKVEIHIPVRQ